MSTASVVSRLRGKVRMAKAHRIADVLVKRDRWSQPSRSCPSRKHRESKVQEREGRDDVASRIQRNRLAEQQANRSGRRGETRQG
jgi:hypothetical protein